MKNNIQKPAAQRAAAKPTYSILPAVRRPSLDPDWRDPFWAPAETLTIQHFRPEGSDHRPPTAARLVYDAKGIHGIFRVEDQFVLCTHRRFQSEVWKDSCVEFFAQPRPGSGYFNFEFNCGGALLASYIVNPERTPNGFKEFSRLSFELGQQIQVRSSLPRRLDPELQDPVVWRLRFFIPFSVFERYLGPLGPIKGQKWRGNFYKCAEENSHPHWGAWAPVEKVDFHRPDLFGTIRFG
jgi:hypothetical protein